MSTLLIIGAGSNIGLATAKLFTSAGYNVALASRTKFTDLYNYYSFDASKPETVAQLFEDVRKDLGDPKIVIYNASLRLATSTTLSLALSLAQFRQLMDINTTSAYEAARIAVDGFAHTGPGSTFIFTGNHLNVNASPDTLVFGMGKSASAHLIKSASLGYKNTGFKFYYVDERQPDGRSVFPTSAKAHADTYFELAQGDRQGDWHHTFVAGRGLTKFLNE